MYLRLVITCGILWCARILGIVLLSLYFVTNKYVQDKIPLNIETSTFNNQFSINIKGTCNDLPRLSSQSYIIHF